MPRITRHRTRQIDNEDLIFKAAFLRGERKLKVEKIASMLGISPPVAVRLLKRAIQDYKCLEVSHRFVRTPQIDDRRMAELERLLEYATLGDTLKALPTASGLHLRSLRVFNSGSADATTAGIEARQREFGRAAAPHVAERIRSATLVGVAWGSTLGRLIDGLERLGYPWQADRHARQFIPVSAEPMQFARSEYTASALARRLDVIVNGENVDDRTQLAITGLPAFIPDDLSAIVPGARRLPRSQQAMLSSAFRQFFERGSPAYRQIFKEREPLIDRVDTLLTGAGAGEKVMGFCNEDLLQTGRIGPGELGEIMIGDLGGVLLTRPALPKKAQAIADRLHASWTGINRDHLLAIARRAAEQKTPGVILITLGDARTDIVCEVLVQGLCTELIIDHELAQSLKREIENRMARPGPQTQRSSSAKGSDKSRVLRLA